MSPCAFHPDAPAAASCELCGAACCRECARQLLGRTYCPACAARVRAIATGSKPPTAGHPALTAVTAPDPATTGQTARPSPRGPGWASALLYLVFWWVLVFVVAPPLLALPLIVANMAHGGGKELLTGKFDVMDAGRIGLPLWSFFLGILGWGTLLVTVAVTASCTLWLERRRFVDLGLRRTLHLTRDLVTGLLLSAVLFISVIGLGAGRGLYEVDPNSGGGDALLIAVVGFLLLLPRAAVEEIAMRGYVLQAVRRSWGTGAGVAVSTLAFVVLHLGNPGLAENPLALIGLALAGLYLASAYLITGDLWLAIFLHTGWNLMEGPIFGTPVSGHAPPISVFLTRAWGAEIWTGGSFGPEAGLLLCGLMLVHIAALWALRPVIGRTPPAPEPPQMDADLPPSEEYRAIPLGRL